MTVYWIVWDAAAPWITDHLVAAGDLPALARLRAAGVRAAARPPAPNCQTPPSLASLFTGCRSRDHGVTGFRVPLPAHGPTGISGFAPRFPERPPVWRTLERRGGRSALVHVPWALDGEHALTAGLDGAVEAFSGKLSPPVAFGAPPAPGARAPWPVADLAVEVVGRADGCALTTAEGTFAVPGDGDWVSVPLPGHAGFWASCQGGPEGAVLVRTGAWRRRVAGGNERLVQRLAQAPAFAGKGVGPLYRDGVFGPRLRDGGDGSAEDVLLSAVGCVAQAFTGAVETTLAHHEAELVVVYLPWTDEVGHELAGLCDVLSAAHRSELAPAAWSRLRRAYRLADDVLARVLARAAPDVDTVLLSADHGMVGSTHRVHLNRALIDAGLARVGPDGELDADSPVCYHAANSGLLLQMGDDLTLLREAIAVLRAIEGPDGRSVVAGLLDADGRRLAENDDLPSAVYVVLHDDLQPSASTAAGSVVRPWAKTAAHLVNTGAARLHATFAAAGPGLRPGTDLGVIDTTFAALLVCRQLGLPLPTDQPAPDRSALVPIP